MPDLEDLEPYPAWLKRIEKSVGAEQFGSKTQLTLTIAFDKEGNDTLLDWAGITIGVNKEGKPSKLRQILNALADKPAMAEIAWFDDETFEWAYPDNPEEPYNSLLAASENRQPFVIRGAAAKRKDGTDTWKIQNYQQYKKEKKNGTKPETTQQRAQRVRQEAAESVDPDDVPF